MPQKNPKKGLTSAPTNVLATVEQPDRQRKEIIELNFEDKQSFNQS